MHAFLFIIKGDPKKHIEDLSKKLAARVLEYKIAKVEDVRELGNFIKLSVGSPTLIYSQDIEGATTEALNAFLKNLEEPQENIFYALTSQSVRKVLPTIVSRCQIITITEKEEFPSDNLDNFSEKTIGEKFIYIDKIKTREEALKFVENFLNSLHYKLHKEGGEPLKISKNSEVVLQTLKNLKANGQVGLQLTNMVVSLE